MLESIAQNILQRSQEIARREGYNVCISIVDASALPVAFFRMEDTIPGAIDIAVKKARTAALFRTDSVLLGEQARPGGSTYPLEATNDGLIGFAGGVVIYDESGKVIGGLGISGAPSEVDQVIALEATGRA